MPGAGSALRAQEWTDADYDRRLLCALLYRAGLYPAMQKPQVFFNLFINTASLLIVSIGMTFVILSKGIDLSVAGMIALTSAASAALLRGGAARSSWCL